MTEKTATLSDMLSRLTGIPLSLARRKMTTREATPDRLISFVRQGARWVQKAKLAAKDAERSAGFGEAVDLVGNTAIIGAPPGAVMPA